MLKILSYTSTIINMKIYTCNMLQKVQLNIDTLYNDFHLYVYEHFQP